MFKCLECGAELKRNEVNHVNGYYECISCLGVAERVKTERRYIRDTVADDFKHNWQTELEKREAWLNGVEDIRNTPKGSEVTFYEGEQYGNSLVEWAEIPFHSIGGYGE